MKELKIKKAQINWLARIFLWAAYLLVALGVVYVIIKFKNLI
ncbi:MAG: hypothetical protein AABX17_02115 [Nanoarchaeota archaeon]